MPILSQFLLLNYIGKGKPYFGAIKMRKDETKKVIPNISKAKKILKWKKGGLIIFNHCLLNRPSKGSTSCGSCVSISMSGNEKSAISQVFSSNSWFNSAQFLPDSL